MAGTTLRKSHVIAIRTTCPIFTHTRVGIPTSGSDDLPVEWADAYSKLKQLQNDITSLKWDVDEQVKRLLKPHLPTVICAVFRSAPSTGD